MVISFFLNGMASVLMKKCCVCPAAAGFADGSLYSSAVAHVKRQTVLRNFRIVFPDQFCRPAVPLRIVQFPQKEIRKMIHLPAGPKRLIRLNILFFQPFPDFPFLRFLRIHRKR